MEKEAYAASLAAISNINNITNDRIEALTKSHGMTNIAAMSAANAITTEVLRGVNIMLTDENTGQLQVNDVLKKGIEAAKEAGADSANAALFAATICYFAGSNAQAGVPAGNRKLGGLARMIAGVDRSGVAAIPTPKSNNKVSGFAAVQALYEELIEGNLTKVDGRKLPLGVAGGPLYGHSHLGEDISYPEISSRGAEISTKAMMDAQAGAGMAPNGIISAIIGVAATLEVVHPDAGLGEEYGEAFKVKSANLAGKHASKVAGLPEKLHIRGTGEEYDTAQLVGDLGVILKDIGAPSVIGMMSFEEMLSAFEEGVSGFSGGPIMPPLGHITADLVISLRSLISNNGDKSKSVDILRDIKKTQWLEPELAATGANTIARKVEQVRRGPITEIIITATEGMRANLIHNIAHRAYEELKSGKSLKEVVSEIDEERKEFVEKSCAQMLGSMTGHELEIKITKLTGGCRRDIPFVKEYYGFDTDADVELVVDGKKINLSGIAQNVIPDAIFNQKQDLLDVLPFATIPISELQLSGHTILYITIPSAVAAAMNLMDPKEAAKQSEAAASCTAAIPGAKPKAKEVAELAVRIVKDME